MCVFQDRVSYLRKNGYPSSLFNPLALFVPRASFFRKQAQQTPPGKHPGDFFQLFFFFLTFFSPPSFLFRMLRVRCLTALAR